MSILFSVYCNNYQSLTKLSDDILTESQKIGVQIADKIKGGFISLINSISNSFSSLHKMFSFSNEDKNVNSDKKEPLNVRTIPSIFIEDEEKITLDNTSLKSASQAEFDKLKSEMHAKLNICLNNRGDI